MIVEPPPPLTLDSVVRLVDNLFPFQFIPGRRTDKTDATSLASKTNMVSPRLTLVG
jgi:hypothetical protein